MESHLIEQEKHQLREFRFTAAKSPSELSIELEQLMDTEILSDYLMKLSKLIGAPNPQTTASIFMKRYAFIAVIFLYSMTVYNKRLDISFSNVSLETIRDQEQWLPQFYFKQTTAIALTGDRNEWRKESIKQLFAEHLCSIMNLLIKETKISKHILWENISIYIYWLYEKILMPYDNMEIRRRAQEDFHNLIHEAPGNIFDSSNRNLLNKYKNDLVFIREHKGEVRIRTTCCLSYRLKTGGKYCKTCPQRYR